MAGAILDVQVDVKPALEMMRIAHDRAIDMRPAMVQVGEHLLRAVRRNFDAQGRPSWPKSKKTRGRTLTASGALMRSRSYVAGQSEVEVFSPLIYAGVHQFGGVIKAKPGKALAIPAKGVTGRPGDYDRETTFILKKKKSADSKGGAFIMQKRVGKKGQGLKPKLLFTLVKSVKMPERPFLTVPDDELTKASDIVVAHVWRSL